MTKFRRRLEWREWRMNCALQLLLFLVVPTTLGDLVSDRNALLAFKDAVDPNDNLKDWTTNVSTCMWTGINCGDNGLRVWKLRLPGRGLVGTIPIGTLGALDQLRAISLHSNRLSGSLPLDIAGLGLVQNIYLHENQLSGPLPLNLTSWPRLLTLSLADNQFNGSIPDSIAQLKLIKGVYFEGNQLSGRLPDITTATLKEFNVANNNLSGSIPVSLQRFGNSSFAGNPNICGAPTNNSCPASPPPPVAQPSAGAPGPTTPGPTPGKRHKNRLSTGVIIAIVVGDAALLLLLFGLCFFCYRRRKQQRTPKSAKPEVGAGKGEDSKDEYSSSMQEPERSKLIFLEGKNYTFDLEDLLRASAEVLGKGSVGTAYKAVLEDGSIVTVKRLKDVTTAKKDFETQIEAVGKLQHRNLVPLRAYYFSKDEKLLVYDYMPAGSLSALLHGKLSIFALP